MDSDGWVYVICYTKPTLVNSRDILINPESAVDQITHYVGFTRQVPPLKRVQQHGANSAQQLVALFRGSEDDELFVKMNVACPKCGRSLWYYTDVPDTRPKGRLELVSWLESAGRRLERSEPRDFRG